VDRENKPYQCKNLVPLEFCLLGSG